MAYSDTLIMSLARYVKYLNFINNHETDLCYSYNIARRLDTTNSAIVSILKRLKSMKLVKRAKSTNNRKKPYKLTREGKKILERINKIILDLEELC